MERLILEYTTGDGYTYTANVTMPILYSSKEEARDDLTLLVLEHIDNLIAHNKKREQLFEKTTNSYNKWNKINPENQKIKQEAFEQYKESQKAYTVHEESLKDEFSFGGNSFKYSSLMSLENEVYYPVNIHVSTLNEYFSSVEKKVVKTVKMS